MEGIRVPGTEECFRLLEREGVPGHVVEHSMVVADVAVLLGNHLNAAGESLDVAVLRAGGLLHDVAKHHSFGGKGDHAEMGAALLEGMGLDRLGEIVRYHVRLPEKDACYIRYFACGVYVHIRRTAL